MNKKAGYFLLVIFTSLSVFCAHTPSVQADPPLAARLLAEPYESTGTRVQVSNFGNLRGLANDGETVYMLDSSGNIFTVPLSSITITPGGSVSVVGTSHTVGWGIGDAPTTPDLGNLSLAYSHGCLFITDGTNSEGSIGLYCIDVSDYSVTEIEVPAEKPLPAGAYYVYSSLIDFPDGRVGKVSAYQDLGGGTYQSTLRLYTVSGTGAAATITWSEDILMNDTSNWATDEHGIATDGTYLYRIQWKAFNPDTKVWQLETGAPSSLVYSGEYTQPFDNMHFLSHNHTENYYLVGHWNNQNFFITSVADPGPGPGNPLTPTFDTPTSVAGGFTVQVTNYDAAFDWSVESTEGSVEISDSGLITVSGLGELIDSTVTVTTSRSGYPDGSADVTGISLDITPPTIINITSDKANGYYTVGEVIDIDVTFSETVTSDGSVTVTLETGDTDRTCTFTVTSATTGTCNYTVQAGDTTSDLTVGSISGTILDVADNTMVDFEPETNLSTNKTIVIDTTAPVLTETSAVSGDVTIENTTYYFTASEVCEVLAESPTSSEGEVELYIDAPVPETDLSAYLSGIQVRGTYSVNFLCIDEAGNSSNTLQFGPFRVISNGAPISLPILQSIQAFNSQQSVCVEGSVVASCNKNSTQNTQSTDAQEELFLFKVDLKRGQTHPDVQKLQNFLNKHGFPVSRSGVGSLGNETTYFGSLTYNAVVKFQEKYRQTVLVPIHSSKGTGFVGIYTRAELNKQILEENKKQ